MAETETRPALPPYVPYRTFITFLDTVRGLGVMPSHIDKSVMSSLSGGMQSWLRASLRYMKLINAEGEPDDRLERLAFTQGDERKSQLRELFKSTYGFLNGKIDLQNTTPQKLRSAVLELGAQGETVDKILAFMVAMAKDAGVPISSLLTKRSIAPRRPRVKPIRRDESMAADIDEEIDIRPPAVTREQILIDMLDPERMDDAEKSAVWTLLLWLKKQGA